MRRQPNTSLAWWPGVLSASAGCFGAAAAVFGKAPGALQLGLTGRVACYAALFTCNAAVMALYLRSLRRLPSLQATVYSNAANIIATGLLGRWLYGETIGPRWLLGVACILLGLTLVTAAAAPPPASAATPDGAQERRPQHRRPQQEPPPQRQHQELHWEAMQSTGGVRHRDTGRQQQEQEQEQQQQQQRQEAEAEAEEGRPAPTATTVSPPTAAAASSSPCLSPPTAVAAAAEASPLQVPASLPSASAVASTPAAPTAPSVIIPSLEDRSNGLGRLGRLSYRLILAYDGTEYCGWQLQPSAPTVQRTLEGALCTVLREERAVLGVRAAGRTDSGVHARGQVVQFSCNRELDVAKMPYKLNSVLPHDIRVLRLTRTAPDFSVTCSALGKCYHYSLTNAEAHDPLRHRYCLHVRRPLDLAAMRTAAAALEGTHDFTQFSNIGEEAGRPRRRNPVKTLRRVEVVELGGESTPGGIRIEVEGSGFLYKMVRHISGALVAVGEGRLPVATIGQMLEVGNNAPPGCHGTYRGYNVAPAKGLCLHQVFYDPGVDDPSVLLYPELRHDEYGRLLESIPDARSDED
ncbi:hypothetical protein PLESTB_000269700 [Pleodorina starrii]|uniref:Pseudouridine synthase I TruA alpha/beta domain-containing protein n=1 Tax=Pleodorina starrii TaxID=330485 RepID=A0A9W6EYK7_9CHLO|nr:hypothetical protein PLESTB_000269700 [Pleodorina starrii]